MTDDNFDEGHDAGYEAAQIDAAAEIASLKAKIEEARDIIAAFYTQVSVEGQRHFPHALTTRARAFLKGGKMTPPEPIRRDELDIVGEVFGIRFTEGCSTGCVELYAEDDEFWHLQMTFDRLWLDDLQGAISGALRSLKGETDAPS